ncbi:MAG: hypothetical protein ABSB26_03255 [Nitrososphaerales archaeon]|jgi:hypothetical protein
MSSSEGDEQGPKYEFKGKFAANPPASHPILEASHEEVDAFVREILGLTKPRDTDSTAMKS